MQSSGCACHHGIHLFYRPKKPETDDYQPVQDLWAVNQPIITLHPIIPNMYTLLGLIPTDTTFFTRLNLKDAFF